ncbi:prohibitin family protein [Leptospira ellisii]|uniref:Peptidase n=1 Tax=Leptospira ellisii TaxID=2023197 RepID=A0A2N0BAK2_9LEPT|nr:prohibitin family protein [Leptospira ellisii]MDV6235388.1 prohibitin family protein [Leptospira ellisii]PJZ93553.1 peptidase [Leptospira ellisii]PKA06179.1 peptidase [Leptospira ellisii]
MNRKKFFVVLLLFGTLNCGATVRPGEIGLFWKPFGITDVGLSKDPVLNGFYWLLPWNDIYTYSTQWNSYKEKVDVLTNDDLKIDVQAVIIMRPVRDEIFQLHVEVGPEYYKSIVQPEFRASIRNVVSHHQMIQISKNSAVLAKDIKSAVTERTRGKHIEVFDVILDDVEYSPNMLHAIEAKLTKQQELEQQKYELEIAEKNIEIAKRKAKADAEAQLIRAEAQAKSQTIINDRLTTKYLQYKAFESPNSKMIFVPQDKNNLPIVVNPKD